MQTKDHTKDCADQCSLILALPLMLFHETESVSFTDTQRQTIAMTLKILRSKKTLQLEGFFSRFDTSYYVLEVYLRQIVQRVMSLTNCKVICSTPWH